MKRTTLNHTSALTVLALLTILNLSCKKYLAENPSKNLSTPNSLTDLQALLDNHAVMNERSPVLQDLASDDYFLTTATWQGRSTDDQLNYVWDPSATYINSWLIPYEYPVYYSNVVLDQLPIITKQSSTDQYRSIKGSALFFRAFAFEELAQLYCRPYTSAASTDLGIVLRLNSDITVKSTRSTVQQTYSQIISDLKEAATLLPAVTLFPTRPDKAAAFGELARTYLAMRDYNNAGIYADSCLKRYSALMDYNDLVPVGNPPVTRFNKETIFYGHAFVTATLSNTRAMIDTNLYKSYDDNDLRKIVFFRPAVGGNVGFVGGYDGNYLIYAPFTGVTTDEMYLIRAECFARNGNKDSALQDLNTLMAKRWKSGLFIPFTAVGADDAKEMILRERRKELIYRALRWSDLRRLNLEGANITLTRNVNGTTYTLPPNDLRYTMLIPLPIITISGIQQNPR